ncbi:Ekc/keops complex subunit cgi121 [Biomphalaria glabrata]|uniref:EKC/KEOPS complex subunit TPRKB-like n=1 Tax=Biomphalaria glabrata TaxID=6526 RepID=A0A9W2YK74_BIOGL|nr:EKC/KEOPS complex subunit TPRKB-like [Biomphalaria glabrata]
MAAYQKVTHMLYPDTSVTLALFANVESCKNLRKCVMEGTVEAALLKTAMIVDSFQVLVAANKAIHLYHTKSMMTKNVHSEILYCLSPSKNISESFRSFGAADGETSVFVAIVNDAEDRTLKKVTNILGREPDSLDLTSTLSDKKLIAKTYRLTDDELSTFSLLDTLVSRVAAKEIITAGKGQS